MTRLSLASLFVGLLVLLLSPWAARAADHPRLLIAPADLPRLRHACGVGAAQEGVTGKFGAHAADYQAMRSYFRDALAGEDTLPGEVLGAAFLYLIAPDDPQAAERLRVVNTALAKPIGLGAEPLELVIALDWCWPALAPAARRDFLLAMRERAEMLTPGDSPLEPRRFRERLAAVALAVAVDEVDDPNPSWKLLRARLLEEAQRWFAVTGPAFIQARTMSPTGPANAAREECDTALAMEIARHVADRDLWSEHGVVVGRWLEHYLLATLDHPALKHGFIRDDGAAWLTPAPNCREMLPVTAHLLAVRTKDPGAVAVARRVEAALRSSVDPLATVWRWTPIVFDVGSLTEANAAQLPTARNLGGAVVFRAGAGPEAAAVWIDAAQPFLRRRQHFDAGHFLIYRGGHLAVMGGDDVTFEAVGSKRGSQGLGATKAPFDFEQYFTSSIAHNSVVCWDAARVAHWYGQSYIPVGGQRCIEETCADFATPLAAQQRVTGKQLGYGQRDGAAYLALDLAAAYDSRGISGCTREFVFVLGKALIVADRVTLTSNRSPATWVLNIPTRPTVDGKPLRDDARIAGATNNAGVWRYDGADWLRWADNDGALWMKAIRPEPRVLRIVGGPGEKLLIPSGTHQGRGYFGGSADGFERLVLPAERRAAQNAWYRLGEPDLLSPDIGQTGHWGRIEMEPLQKTAEALFVTVLVMDRATGTEAPQVATEEGPEGLTLRLKVEGRGAEVRLNLEGIGGRVVLPQATTMPRTGDVTGPGGTGVWELPRTVEADGALPTK